MPPTIHRQRPTLAATAVAFVVAVGIGACTPIQPLPTLQPDLPPSPVVGVVVGVDEESLGVINYFDVRMADGKTVSLTMGVLDNALEFSPSHLATHVVSGAPIRAFYRLQNGLPTVYHLEDAVPESQAPSAT